MRSLPLIRSLILASTFAGGLVDAAPHKELPPIPTEALQAVRAAQHGRDDLLVNSLERHLQETRALADRGEQTGTRLKAAASTAQDDGEISTRRSEAAAKRQEIRNLRNEVLTRIDAAAQAADGRGAKGAAGEARELRRQLVNRFDALDGDLSALEKADRHTLGPRSRQAAQRIESWLSSRPVAPLAPPNWTLAAPQPMVELPAAKEAPRFVADTLWLLRHHFVNAGGLMHAALRNTPSEAAACGYTAADLADTPEAPKSHADIQALAKELDYNPARIFAWVNQNVAYEPYFGSLKGGVSTLWAKAGGATDQASLLIALLRAANVPTRYVRGTVSVLDNTAKGADGRGPRWIGAKTYQGAASVLSANGNPSASYGPNNIGLAHVWVEACLPYSAYRGAALDDSGHRWVPLDASYKDHRYQAGIALDSSFDFDYTGWLASRLDGQGRYRLPHESLADQAEISARTKAPNYANNTLEDIPYKSEIKRTNFDILPIVPPYEVISYDSWSGVAGGSAETAALPDRHRYRLQVSVRNKSGTIPENFTGNLLSQKTLNLADVATSRLTLAFRGAMAGDQTAYDTWLNSVDPALAPSCAATANVVPVLRLDGVEQTKDAGSGTTTLCSSDNVLQLSVTVAELTKNAGVVSATRYATIAAASLQALHANAWHTSDAYLAKRTENLLAAVRNNSNPNASEAARDAIEGEFLNLAASKYSRYVVDAARDTGRLFGESGTTGVSLGLTSAQVKVNYLFDLPYGLFRKGFLVDWPGSLSTSTRLDGTTGDFRAFKLGGFAGSAYEAFIWQETANLDAVSTTRGMQFAKEQGIEILQINNASDWAAQKSKLTSNTNSALNYSASHVTQIETAYVNAGFKLTIPRSLIQYPDSTGWKGAAFYSENFTSSPAQAGFPIGAYSGGVTVEPSAGTAASGEGSTTYGGSGTGVPVGDAYNASTGNGIFADINATIAAWSEGRNSTTTRNGSCEGATCSGDPVNMVTGNLVHNERDIAIKGRGGLPLVFERWYNSNGAKDGPLGYGWTHSFNHFIRFYGVEGGVAKLGWNDGTGGERFFSTSGHANGNINIGAPISASAGIYATVERLANGTYRITERSGMKYVFESVNGTAADTLQKARLLSISDKNNNTLTLAYSATCGNNLCTVTDGLNRALTFTYVGSRINQISDWSSRTWQYTVDANGDLTTFKNPLAVAGSQAPVSYQYYTAADGVKLAHAMKHYQLPRGNGMRFEYYANGRVFRHTPFANGGELQTASATTFNWAEFRREAKQVDGQGNVRTFLFDKYGNPISITDEAGAETTYSYDQTAGRTNLRLSKTAANGQTTSYAYDTAGNLSDVTLPSGKTLQYRDYTALGQPQRVKDAANNWTLNRFDAAGNLTDSIQLKAGIVPVANTAPASANIVAWTQYQGDSIGNPTLIRRLRDWSAASLGNPTSGVGPSLESAYDTNKLNVTSLTKRGDKDGTPSSLESDTTTDFSYDNLGRMKRGPDAAWYAADSDYDSLDRPIKSPDGRGNTWATSYDANGNPVNVGLTISGAYVDGHYATWDDLDRLERQVDYAGNASLNRYNALGHLIATTGADGYTLGFDRDPMGRITGADNEEGHRVSFSLDVDGRPRSLTDPNGLTTSYDYYDSSQDGQLKRSSLPSITGQSSGRAVEVAQYDGAGRPTKINAIAADGSIRDSYRYYDELGRLTRAVGPMVSTTDTTRLVSCTVYTALGNLAEIWAGSTTDTTSPTCTLDGVNVKKQLSATYDDFGRKLTQTDQLGKVWKWTWNVHGELLTSQTPVQAAAGQTTTYAYGAKGGSGETQGQLKSRTVPGAQTASYTRNPLGQVTKAETKDGASQTVVAYDYSYDSAHRLQTVIDSRANKSLTYTWTPGGRLARVVDSDGHSTSFAYDGVGRLSSLTAPNGENVSFVWDAGGRLVEKRLNSGLRTTQSWFEDGSLKDKKNLFSATTLSSHTYTLDSQGRRATQAETINGSAKSWAYQYDNLDRLTSSSDGSAETTSYDIYGNRRTKSNGGGTTAYLYDLAHQLSEIHQTNDTGALIGAAVHDADGHLTKLCEGSASSKTATDCTAGGTGATTLALAWNALDHLLMATRTGANAVAESYVYDDSGRRLRKTSAGATTHYGYDGDDIHAEWATTLAGMPSAVYAHGVGNDEPLLRLTGSTNSPAATQTAYLQDGLGSVIATVNGAGALISSQRFDAWGNKGATTGTTPTYGFTGREPDATGLTYFRARYQHPGIGRFLSRDPAGMADAVSPYAYVRNSPINFVDPFGLAVQLNLFAPGTPEWKAAEAFQPPSNTYVIAGHSNPKFMEDQRQSGGVARLTGSDLALMTHGDSKYDSSMNTILLGCSNACPRGDGKPPLAQEYHNSLAILGGQGATAGTNSFVWLDPNTGTATVAPDIGGKRWSDIRTEQDAMSLRPDLKNSGGYTIYGTPTEGLFQQPFSKQLDNVLNGKTNGIRDWLPFGQSLGDFQSGDSGAPYSGGATTGIDVRATK
jgi:RHS repeat-associated protein